MHIIYENINCLAITIHEIIKHRLVTDRSPEGRPDSGASVLEFHFSLLARNDKNDDPFYRLRISLRV